MISLKSPALRGRKLSLFEASFAASFGAHALIWAALSWQGHPSRLLEEPIEVDIRTPFRPRAPWDTRLPGTVPGAPAPESAKKAPVLAPPAPEPKPPAPNVSAQEGTPSEKPKEWVLPTPETKKLEQPTLEGGGAPAPPPAFTAPDGSGPGGQFGRGGSGGGPGTGEAIVNRPPRLINREEVRANLRRFYPDLERRAGREAQVIVGVEIREDGIVGAVEILQSAGSSFDAAARSVAKLMRFEPALKASVPTKVTVRQAIYFRLEN